MNAINSRNKEFKGRKLIIVPFKERINKLYRKRKW